jgi:hypothetical protein
MSDWGVTVGDGNTSDFTMPAVPGALFFGFALEDQNDLAGDSGYVGPNHGGQNYDVEFMAVALSATRMYIAIVTGQRPDNGLARFSPGDIRIVGNDGKVYGIEVGGGPGGAPGAGLLTQDGGALGSTYNLNGSGFTLSHVASDRLVGSIWENPNWLVDPLPPATEVQLTSAANGTLRGMADFAYTRNDDPTMQHSVIELSIDRAIFGTATELDIYWAPSCGNDVLMVHDDVPPGRIPAPGTLASLGIGLLALRCLRRRR